jgi:hypothetical protein
MRSIERTISFLYKLSATASLGDDLGLVRLKTLTTFHMPDIVLQALRPATAIQTGLGVLLNVCAFITPRRYRYDIRVH